MAEILIQTGETLAKSLPPPETETTSSWDILYLLRILFYILVAVKLIELSFLRRKKHSLKERVYRKFLFAHQELLKQFSQEDKANMEYTLSNTIKNANVQLRPARSKNNLSRKRVNFTTQKNNYYQPKQWKNDSDDEGLYLDVEDSNSKTLFNIIKEDDTRGKMIEEEFGERQNLEKISQKQEEIQIEASKLSQATQPSSSGPSEITQVSDLPVQSKHSLLSKGPPKDSSEQTSEQPLKSDLVKKAE